VKIDKLRIHHVPEHVGDCEICTERRVCHYVDRDFRGASVCMGCAGFVIIAEKILNDAGLQIPSTSQLLNDSTP
jgi:hypothetical protein